MAEHTHKKTIGISLYPDQHERMNDLAKKAGARGMSQFIEIVSMLDDDQIIPLVVEARARWEEDHAARVAGRRGLTGKLENMSHDELVALEEKIKALKEGK